jgi:hypothetical protein
MSRPSSAPPSHATWSFIDVDRVRKVGPS